MFFVDIVLTFFCAYHDEDFVCVDDQKTIACEYLRGWFMIDTLAILPFTYMMNIGGADASTL
jgi:hypothetical protein